MLQTLISRANNFFLIGIILILSSTVSAQHDLSNFIDSILNENNVTGNISVTTLNLATGLEKSFRGDELLEPASVLKLITTSASLESLGADHTFSTRLAYNGVISDSVLIGDLVIIAGGDPTLGSSRFQNNTNSVKMILERWNRLLVELGINEISGDIIVNQSYYGKDISLKWDKKDLGNYYGALPHAFTIADNEYDLYFDISGTKTKVKKTVPHLPRLKIDNSVKATSMKSDQAYIHALPYNWNVKIQGAIPGVNNTFKIRGSIPDPALYFLDEMQNHFESSGILLRGDKINSYRILNDSLVVIDKIYSPPLSEIIKVTNHKSVNLYAEHLAFQFGKTLYDTINTISSSRALEDFLQIKSGATQLQITDGSGLAEGTRISTKMITRMLKEMDAKEYNVFRKSLPVSGVSGTLKSFGKGTVLSGNVRAKSGYKNGVRSYAGYMTNKSKERIAFCVIANNYRCSNGRMKIIIEEILLEIYRK